ncbi:glucose-1-phosphate adenylyltransferase [Hydrocarboniphaga sp.]|uniref:glucose-1-phosphate adenylyltransferase n=1 Tax=Hydrocarboniphaga sp. TaxID=2033016 RepID=UPI003D0C4D29
MITHISASWSFLHREFNEFVEILPAQQHTGSDWYKGTADAIHQNTEIIHQHAPQFVLILGGDHIYKMDYGAMLGFHVSSLADVTVGCIEVPIGEATAFGVMGADSDSRVLSFQEKPRHPASIPGRPDTALASMGIYVFNANYLDRMLSADAANVSSTHDFGYDVLPAAVSSGDRVYAYPFRDPLGNQRGYWRDVGTIDSYWKANLELAQVDPPLNLYDRNWPIWTYQEQVPPAKFVFDEDTRRGHALDSLVAGGCIVSGAVVRSSLLFPNVHVHEGTEIEESVILRDVTVGRNCRLRKVIVESSCSIPDGMVVGFNPEMDKSRFDVTDHGVTLVTAADLAALTSAS